MQEIWVDSPADLLDALGRHDTAAFRAWIQFHLGVPARIDLNRDHAKLTITYQVDEDEYPCEISFPLSIRAFWLDLEAHVAAAERTHLDKSNIWLHLDDASAETKEWYLSAVLWRNPPPSPDPKHDGEILKYDPETLFQSTSGQERMRLAAIYTAFAFDELSRTWINPDKAATYLSYAQDIVQQEGAALATRDETNQAPQREKEPS